MPAGLSGLIIALLLTAMLAYQATQASGGTRLRLAYWLGAGAMALVSLFNLLVLLQVSARWLGTTLVVLALSLLAGSITAFAISLFNGELKTKMARAREVATAERERLSRGRRTDASPDGEGDRPA